MHAFKYGLRDAQRCVGALASGVSRREGQHARFMPEEPPDRISAELPQRGDIVDGVIVVLNDWSKTTFTG